MWNSISSSCYTRNLQIFVTWVSSLIVLVENLSLTALGPLGGGGIEEGVSSSYSESTSLHHINLGGRDMLS